MNAVTAPSVPDAWLEHVTKGEMNAAQKEARAGAIQRDKYATLASVALLFLGFLLLMSVTAFFEDYVNEMVRLRILMDVRRDAVREAARTSRWRSTTARTAATSSSA